MDDAAPEHSTTRAATSDAEAARDDLAAAFALHAEVTPPLSWLAALSALGATLLRKVLLPALGDKRGYAFAYSRPLDLAGTYLTNLSAIAGLIALGFALLSFVRYNPLLPLRRRLMFAAFSGVFLPSIALATLFERERTTAETVVFAMGAAFVLMALAGTTAARVSRGAYGRTLALACALLAAASLISQVLQVGQRVTVRAWMGQALSLSQGTGEVTYLLLLCALSPLLLPVGGTTSARAGRMAAAFLLPLLLAGFYVGERALGRTDYELVLYHAQRVSLFIDSFPRLYAIPLSLALSCGLAAGLGGDGVRRQAGAGALLLVASGYAPFEPGRLVVCVLGAVLVCRSLMQTSTPRGRTYPATR